MMGGKTFATRTRDGRSVATAEMMTKPELLAPAGDRTCLVAAIENGADAVYFGLQGHNARARAANFDATELAEVMALLHRRGVKGIRHAQHPGLPRRTGRASRRPSASVAAAGVDAVIVQDLGLARLIRAVAPTWRSTPRPRCRSPAPRGCGWPGTSAARG